MSAPSVPSSDPQQGDASRVPLVTASASAFDDPHAGVGPQVTGKPVILRPSLLKRPFPRSSEISGDTTSVGERGVKRVPEQDVVDLEQEMEETGMEDTQPMQALFWASEGSVPVCVGVGLTDCEFFDVTVSSVKFDGDCERENKSGESSKIMLLGGASVRVWCPQGGVDDSTMEELPGNLVVFAGVQEEISNLEKCKTGVVITSQAVQELRGNHPHMRLIQSRWVCARKNPAKVRCRIVAKDIAHGSARKQGFSSPTPSHDAFVLIVALLATHNLRCCAADISHAFMHSPLTAKEPIVLKLPLSVSLLNGEPAYLRLHCALNGLRDASQAWLHLLSTLITPLGLQADDREPCLFSGRVECEGENGRALCLVYVDDLLIVCDSGKVENMILNSIRKRVSLKVTGQILPDREGGGTISFIGRTVRRWPHQSSVEVFVKASYLDSCFDAYQVRTRSTTMPNIANTLEQSSSSPPLSAEAYSKFRRVLGKLLWYCQTRQDLKLPIGLISTQQASPSQATEAALRSLLRFLREDKHVVLKLPSPGLDPSFFGCEDEQLRTHVHVFADASHAPYRCLGRKGVSGGAMCYAGALIRSMAKVQGVVSMSSCEAELHALQFMCQESVGLVFLLERVLTSLEGYDVWVDSQAYMYDEDDESQRDSAGAWITTQLCTDSQSAIDLLANQDLPRRSRRIEIRVAWLRHKIERGQLSLKWLAGSRSPADMFTKCLNKGLFVEHRERLGFHPGSEGPMSQLFELSLQAWTSGVMSVAQNKRARIAVLEVCCSEGSSLSRVCRDQNVPYAGVIGDVQSHRVIAQA